MAAPPERFAADIVAWVNTFDGVACTDVSQLCDGVVLASVLAQISPPHEFAATRGDSATVSKTNLTLLVNALEEFYKDEVGKTFDLDFIDLHALAGGAVDELAKLIEFVVGAAVTCAQKEVFIEKIMAMDAEAQPTLFFYAQSIMAREEDGAKAAAAGDGAPPPASPQAPHHTHRLEAERGELRNTVADLEASLRQARDQLAARDDQLHEARMATDSAHATNERLQRQLEDLRGQLTAENDAMRERLQAKEDEVRASRQKDDFDSSLKRDNIRLEAQLRKLEDENDVLKGKDKELGKARDREEKLKRRLEEMETVRRRMNEIEELSAERLEQIMKLEPEVDGLKKQNTHLLGEIERLKNDAVDTGTRLIEANSSREVAESSLEELRSATEAELEDLKTKLEDANERAAYFENELVEATGGSEHQSDAGIGVYEESVPRLKEAITRLTRENERLKAAPAADAGGDAGAGAGAGEADLVLQSRMEMLQAQLEQQQKRCTDLQAKNQHLTRQLAAAPAPAADAATATAADTARVHKLEADLAAASKKLAAQQALALTVNKLTEDLKEKESLVTKVTSDKEKLESYTKKALHSVQDKYMLAIKTCKDQLKDKDDQIAQLKNAAKLRMQQERRESQLMSSAIYELGMEIIERRLVTALDTNRGAPGTPSNRTWIQRQRDEVNSSGPL